MNNHYLRNYSLSEEMTNFKVSCKKCFGFFILKENQSGKAINNTCIGISATVLGKVNQFSSKNMFEK